MVDIFKKNKQKSKKQKQGNEKTGHLYKKNNHSWLTYDEYLLSHINVNQQY